MSETNKKYELRKLNASDIFPMSRIIGKIGIDEFGKCFESAAVQQIIKNGTGKESIQDAAGIQVVLEIANIIISNLGNVEKEIFQFLSNISGLSLNEVKNLEMAEFAVMLIDVVKKEEFMDFFKVVSKLFK